MQPLVTSAEIRTTDRLATREFAVPSMLLMENAGRGVVDSFERVYGPAKGKTYLVVCGRGNNGGDGIVAARHLAIRGGRVTLLLLHRSAALRPDPAKHYSILTRILPTLAGRLEIRFTPTPRAWKKLPEHDFIIDAILGTGFHGKPDAKTAAAIHWINQRPERVLAVDMPTGLDADTGVAAGGAVHADLTVTMHARKIGLSIGEARDYTGSVEVVDIGIPSEVSRGMAHAFLLGGEDVRTLLPRRPFNAHKHSVGKILVIAGSRGMTGAAAMTAGSAMRAGAGSVILAAPESIYRILARKLTEVMVIPVAETAEGTVAPVALAQLRSHLSWADVLVVGPGLSRNPETTVFVSELLQSTRHPVLIDADGFNALKENPGIVRGRKAGEVILTPHAGEFARLSGLTAGEIEANRIEAARTFAARLGVTLVLKGAPTITAGENREVVVNPTGNPGMATAGSGDILAGMIAGLWSQHMRAFPAAMAGVYLHGMCGDLARARLGERSMLATDILESLPAAFAALETART